MKLIRTEEAVGHVLYHPDVCEHSRSQEIFQEILTERAEILEHMAQ